MRPAVTPASAASMLPAPTSASTDDAPGPVVLIDLASKTPGPPLRVDSSSRRRWRGVLMRLAALLAALGLALASAGDADAQKRKRKKRRPKPRVVALPDDPPATPKTPPVPGAAVPL